MEDIELKLEQELNNPINSKEYLIELVKQYMLYNKGYKDGNNSIINTLHSTNKELKKQIAYLQGNNEEYINDIETLKKAIINDFINIEQIISKETDNTTIKYINNGVLKILKEIKSKINNRFFEYLNPEYTKTKGFIAYGE